MTESQWLGVAMLAVFVLALLGTLIHVLGWREGLICIIGSVGATAFVAFATSLLRG